jgi:alpha/beta superfamily hydrolase
MGAAQDPRPKLLAVPEHDQYRPPESARSLTSSWEACRVEVVPGTDHFFAGASGIATELLVEFLRSLAPPPRPPRTLSR